MTDPRYDRALTLSLLSLIPIAFAAIAAWIPGRFFPPGLASLQYDLAESALVYAGLLAAWHAGAGAGKPWINGRRDESSIAYYAFALLLVWSAVWPAGSFTGVTNDIVRYLVVIFVLVYLWAKDMAHVSGGDLPGWYGAVRSRFTFWAAMGLALILTKYLLTMALRG